MYVQHEQVMLVISKIITLFVLYVSLGIFWSKLRQQLSKRMCGKSYVVLYQSFYHFGQDFAYPYIKVVSGLSAHILYFII